MAENKYSLWSWKRSEIFFVFLTILIVFGISYFQLKDGERKTRDAQRRADVELVARKLEDYYSDHNIYPHGNNLGQIVSCGESGLDTCNWGEGPLVDDKNVAYMERLPQDPFAFRGHTYVYVPSEKRDKFKIYVSLERTKDPDYKKDLTTECGSRVQCNWYVEK